MINNIINPVVIRDQESIILLSFIMSFVVLGNENDDKKLILYSKIQSTGSIAIHWISIQRKKLLNNIDNVERKKNSIMNTIQGQN